MATWRSFFANNQRSARNRLWMPAAGNHENEVGNGPQGYLAYQTRYSLPHNGSRTPGFAGNWYAFTVVPAVWIGRTAAGETLLVADRELLSHAQDRSLTDVASTTGITCFHQSGLGHERRVPGREPGASAPGGGAILGAGLAGLPSGLGCLPRELSCGDMPGTTTSP